MLATTQVILSFLHLFLCADYYPQHALQEGSQGHIRVTFFVSSIYAQTILPSISQRRPPHSHIPLHILPLSVSITDKI